jgi:hypothetical protein
VDDRGNGETQARLEWTVSPWRESAGSAALAVVAALGLWLVAIRALPGEPLTASLLGLVALVILAPGMAVTRCRVDAEGAARRVLFGWERRRWEQIRRARLGERGLFVSTLAAPTRLDRFRGLFLPLPRRADEGVRLRDAIREALGRHGY